MFLRQQYSFWWDLDSQAKHRQRHFLAVSPCKMMKLSLKCLGFTNKCTDAYNDVTNMEMVSCIQFIQYSTVSMMTWTKDWNDSYCL